jgi:hypothetical protein
VSYCCRARGLGSLLTGSVRSVDVFVVELFPVFGTVSAATVIVEWIDFGVEVEFFDRMVSVIGRVSSIVVEVVVELRFVPADEVPSGEEELSDSHEDEESDGVAVGRDGVDIPDLPQQCSADDCDDCVERSRNLDDARHEFVSPCSWLSPCFGDMGTIPYGNRFVKWFFIRVFWTLGNSESPLTCARARVGAC